MLKNLQYLLAQKKDTVVIILFFLLPFVGFWRNFDIGGLNLQFFHADFIGYYYPDFVQGVEVLKTLVSFKSITDVFWDPYTFLGFPLLGAVDRIGLFYPVRLLFYTISMFFPQNYWIFFATYYSLFHLSLAGIGTYFFAKTCLKFSRQAAFLTGIVYVFGGALLYVGVFTNVVTGPAYLPFELYLLFTAMQKKSLRRAVAAGLLLAPILLSGYTSTFIYNSFFIAFFLFAYFVRDTRTAIRCICYLFVFSMVAIVISLPVLLPSIEIKQMAIRQELNYLGSAAHAFPISSILDYFVPFLLGQKGTGLYGYIGSVSLIFVFIAYAFSKRFVTGLLFGMALVFFVLSLTQTTFLYDMFYKFLPFFSQFRFHIFLQYLVALPLAVLAGEGLEIITRNKIPFHTILRYFKYPAVISLFIYVLSVCLPYISPRFFDSELVKQMSTSVIVTALFLISGLLIVRFGYRSKILPILFILVITLDLFTTLNRLDFLHSNYDPRVFNSASAVVKKYREELKLYGTRAYFHESTLRYNAGVEGIKHIGGLQGLTPRYYSMMVNHYSTSDSWIPANSPLLDLWGVQYIFTTRILTDSERVNIVTQVNEPIPEYDFGRFLTQNGSWVAKGTGVFVYENLDYIPRATLFTRWERIVDDTKALKRMDELDLHTIAVVNTTEHIVSPSLLKGKGEAVIMEERNSYVKIQTNSDTRALMVLSDLYFPGWIVRIDGKRGDIYRVNLATRGVFVNKGEHVIEFLYEPWSLYIGVTVYFVLLILFLVYMGLKHRK